MAREGRARERGAPRGCTALAYDGARHRGGARPPVCSPSAAMAGAEAKEKSKGKSKGKEAARAAAAADDGGAAAEAAREAVQEGRRLLDVALDLGVRHAAAAAALAAGAKSSCTTAACAALRADSRAPRRCSRAQRRRPRASCCRPRVRLRGARAPHPRADARCAAPSRRDRGACLRALTPAAAALLAASGRDVQKSAAARKNRCAQPQTPRCVLRLAVAKEHHLVTHASAPPDADLRAAATCSCCLARWRPRVGARWCVVASRRRCM